jgi:hypothetical protein
VILVSTSTLKVQLAAILGGEDWDLGAHECSLRAQCTERSGW